MPYNAPSASRPATHGPAGPCRHRRCSIHSDRPQRSALARKLEALGHFSESEQQVLEDIQGDSVALRPNVDFWRIGDRLEKTYVISSGWLARYRLLSDGRRQIISVALPGDLLSLHVAYRRVAGYSLVAITECELREIPRHRVAELYRQHPRLAAGLNWATVRDFEMLSELAVSLGRRSARERLMHAFLELWQRLSMVDLARDHNFAIPLTQVALSDWLGLSVVHLNRTLRGLERDGIIRRENGRTVLIDVPEMIRVSDYRPPDMGELT